MQCPFKIFSQSDYLIQIVDTSSLTEWQTVQIQISWILRSQLIWMYSLQKQGISEFSRTKVKMFFLYFSENRFWHLMHIVFLYDNLYVCQSLFSGKKYSSSLSSAEFAQKVVKLTKPNSFGPKNVVKMYSKFYQNSCICKHIKMSNITLKMPLLS